MRKLTGPTVWSMVHDERRALVRDLEKLEGAEWETPSLCPGWAVHDVLAHLVDTAKTNRRSFVRRMISARFDFDKDNETGLRCERRADPAGTLAAMRASIELTCTPPATIATRLVEAFVHGEDIRQPLGISASYPIDGVVAALDYQLGTSVSMGGGKQRGQGVRLKATDADYAKGRGPEVRGSAIDLLLAVSGRSVKTGALRGAGLPLLSADGESL
ncbi:maleylpyruvate isomerase family mycothiol-dependent enzyme [Arthrobacter sp. TWP1-1]|uniref:maleylpyruvate isomerase family mycothiol-dependent enzyme n=1 Tax=Arthrobacter sp. TWP1-1 TaxID=2804568 RepID=UPI003CEAE2BF